MSRHDEKSISWEKWKIVDFGLENSSDLLKTFSKLSENVFYTTERPFKPANSTKHDFFQFFLVTKGENFIFDFSLKFRVVHNHFHFTLVVRNAINTLKLVPFHFESFNISFSEIVFRISIILSILLFTFWFKTMHLGGFQFRHGRFSRKIALLVDDDLVKEWWGKFLPEMESLNKLKSCLNS